ncbi:MAG: glycosyltransferase [Frankiaceae bacterium]|nr:glycosyltransferase [Frankiaceae bacterium]
MSRPTLPPATDGTPAIAIVVPTHNRADLLPRLFTGLDAQAAVDGIEIVVVNDASTDDTRSVLDDLARDAAVPVQVIHLARNAGPATARNVGWRATTASVVAFTDDDCVPQPGWLAALAAATDTVDMAQGRTLPDPEQREHQGPFSRTLDVASEDGYYQTCNIAYRRDVLERMDGFHEAFRFPAGEDTDFAWRAKEAGASSSFVPEAVVFHDVPRSSLRRAIRDSWRWQSVALAAKRHPGLREKFTWRFIWRPSHVWVLGVLLGVIGVASEPGLWSEWAFFGAMVVAYAVYRGALAPLPGTGPRSRWAVVPGAFLVDAAELIACLWGSIRHRTLVL